MIRRSSFEVRTPDRYADPARPSRMLMQAVLEDALRTMLQSCPARTVRARRLWKEELAWLTADDRSHPFAFERICDALGIEPQVLRARVLGAAARLASGLTP